MRNNIKLIGGFMLAISVATVKTTAEKYYVLPGTSIQARVDLAKAGDSIVILAGTYNGSVTVNKQLDIRRAENAAVTINGNFTVDGLRKQFDLANFPIGLDTTQKLIIKNCKHVNLSNIDLSKANGLEVTTSKVTAASCKFGLDARASARSEIVLKDCTIGQDVWSDHTELLIDNCTVARNVDGHGILQLVKTPVKGWVRHRGGTWTPVDTALPTECIVYQSTIKGYLETTATESWIGYNDLKSISKITNKGTIVGNDIRGNDTVGIRIVSGDIRIFNNKIHNQGANYSFRSQLDDIGIGIEIQNGKSIILNNLIYDNYMGGAGASEKHGSVSYNNDNCGVGILVRATSGTKIIGNIIWNCFGPSEFENEFGDASVVAPFDNVLMKNNNFRNRGHKGGVVSTEHQQDVDPKFVNQSEGDFTLQDDSPAKDAGSSEAWYNDRDGSRNDIGLYGGPLYDPDGKTATKPVVLSAEITPIRLVKGTDTKISLKSRGIVVP
jgi:hypothetical protein